MIPQFSIYIPVKNRPLLLNETLTAIGNQSYTNFECIIGNDGSTDNTLDVIKNFCSKDKRFKHIHNDISRGDPVMSNQLLTVLNGVWAARMDSDDIPKKDWLLHSFEFANKFFNEGGIAFGCQAELFGNNIDISFDKQKETCPKSWACWSLFNYEMNHMGLVFRRDLQLKNGVYYKNEIMNNDWDFISQISCFGKMSNLIYSDVQIRRHGDNVSLPQNVTENMDMLSVKLRFNLIKNKLNFTPTEKEMLIHCTSCPAPYWGFNEQLFVWNNQSIYLELLKEWFKKITLNNKTTQEFDTLILEKVLNTIYQKNKINIQNLVKPENFKLLWLPS